MVGTGPLDRILGEKDGSGLISKQIEKRMGPAVAKMEELRLILIEHQKALDANTEALKALTKELGKPR